MKELNDSQGEAYQIPEEKGKTVTNKLVKWIKNQY